jgi:4-hydroxybenzoate polyprenyltransferase
MSSRELIVRYVRERARPGVFALLAMVMAAIGRWTGGPADRWTGGAGGPVGQWAGNSSAMEFGVAALTAFVLMLAFRVWDDLEDRSHDTREHPQRVTVVADSVAPLVGLAAVLAVVGVSLIAIGPRVPGRLIALAAAAALLGSWYRLRGPRASAVVNGHVVLLKYPLIAYAASAATPSIAALMSLYLALCVYEIVDDPALRASIVARRIAISECALVSAIIVTATLFAGRIP